ncbi:Hypothetical protein R9X50_00355300 [Acrodontium crateriforme]|uniref:25S rRNA adenine-N(1) methyltransferase n=1 Tax=Acrodontium crateriforme TaxID=150365 RepID=A0AAQ3M3U7_9PEZI|nr:Hypothetical protein R9X50_00355300 [Acrodontium crateriforme]
MGSKKSTKAKGSRAGSLSAGRPPTAAKPKASVSAKATRTVINKLHQINKQLVRAKSAGNEAQVKDLQTQVDALGGLPRYQQASIQGQSIERGGDSSLVLMQWLKDAGVVGQLKTSHARLKLLEVGALSIKNACATSGIFDVQRIDLHSQADGILQQDFMERPIPQTGEEKFHIISLSLVLNFVPDAEGRGEMLRRTCQFLERNQIGDGSSETAATHYPSLFLVLPAPCVTNSRYMDEKRLTLLMAHLGYSLIQRKQTTKLVYYLWHWKPILELKRQGFAKTQVNPGVTRNNFAIVLKRSK